MCIIGENLKLSQSMIHDSWYSDKEKEVKIAKDRNGFGFVVVSRNENGNFFHRVGCIIEQTPASRFFKLQCGSGDPRSQIIGGSHFLF